MIGCGVEPGAAELAQFALEAGAAAELDPRTDLKLIRASVVAIHGRHDPVIPPTQLTALAEALPNARTYLVSLYGHSGTVKFRALLGDLHRVPQDLIALAAITGILA